MRSLLSPNRCDEIKKEIVFMFEECQIHSFPINCFEIAKQLNYILKPYSSLSPQNARKAYLYDPDGFSRVEKNSITGLNHYVIYYNDKKNHGRMRWTIFHEIGHIYLGHHDNPDNSLNFLEEAEANFFAKYAIAPPPLIRITRCKTPQDIILHFDVSAEASANIFSYYKKRLYNGPKNFESFERELLELFYVA